LKLANAKDPFQRFKDTFNQAYTPQDWLTSAGYDQRGDSFRHPNSEKWGYSCGVQMNNNGELRAHTLSTNDPLYTAGQGAHDAFSTFCTLFHGGDNKAAAREAGNKLLTINGEPYNKFIQREHMQKQAEQQQQQKAKQTTQETTGHIDIGDPNQPP